MVGRCSLTPGKIWKRRLHADLSSPCETETKRIFHPCKFPSSAPIACPVPCSDSRGVLGQCQDPWCRTSPVLASPAPGILSVPGNSPRGRQLVTGGGGAVSRRRRRCKLSLSSVKGAEENPVHLCEQGEDRDRNPAVQGLSLHAPRDFPTSRSTVRASAQPGWRQLLLVLCCTLVPQGDLRMSRAASGVDLRVLEGQPIRSDKGKRRI